LVAWCLITERSGERDRKKKISSYWITVFKPARSRMTYVVILYFFFSQPLVFYEIYWIKKESSLHNGLVMIL
jgi:hypothetical protein